MYLKFRYFSRLATAFVNRFKLLIAGGIVLGLTIFIFFNFILNHFIFFDVITIGIVGRYPPEKLPEEVQTEISRGLTKINGHGEVEPDLAVSWESPDKGKTWMFKLKKDLYWQDGTPLESKDLKFNYSDVSYELPNKYAITFKLKDQFAPFPSIVSAPLFKNGLLGTGQWKVSKLTLSGGYVQRIELVSGKSKKTYRFYPTEEMAKTALKLGKVQKLIGIFDANPFNKWPTMKTSAVTNFNQIVTVFLNNKDEALKEKNVRQALNYAINKSAFNKERAISPLTPLSWAYNPQVKQYDYNSEKTKDAKNLKLNLVTSPVLLSSAEIIAKDWERAGVKVNLLVSSIIPVDFQAYITIFDLPADPDQYSVWHSTQKGSNISNYSNPRIDKLLEDGRAVISSEERKKIYFDFQRFLVEDSPAIFLYHPVTYTIERK